jgi:hypothetical protein
MEKGTLRSSSKAVAFSASRSWCRGNVDGKEKKKRDEEAKKKEGKELSEVWRFIVVPLSEFT